MFTRQENLREISCCKPKVYAILSNSTRVNNSKHKFIETINHTSLKAEVSTLRLLFLEGGKYRYRQKQKFITMQCKIHRDEFRFPSRWKHHLHHDENKMAYLLSANLLQSQKKRHNIGCTNLTYQAVFTIQEREFFQPAHL